MNYEKHYELLMAKHGHKIKPNDGEYYERHHVIPCELLPLGRKDPLAYDTDNQLYLRGRAHLLAHWMLAIIHPTTGLVHSFNTMSNSGHRRDMRITSKMYEAAKRLHGEKISGAGNPIHTLTGAARERWKANVKAGAAKAMEERGDEIKAKLSAACLARSDEISSRYDKINAKMWSAENKEHYVEIMRTKGWHTPENIAKSGAARKAATALMTQEERKATWGACGQGLIRKRVSCEVCGRDVTANTLATHKISPTCYAIGEIRDMHSKGETNIAIAQRFGVTRGTIGRALKR